MLKQVPSEDDSLKNQTTLTDVTDEVFYSSVKPTEFSVKDRLIQVLLMIVGFGWLRALIFFVIVVIYLLAIVPCHAFCQIPWLNAFFLPYSLYVSKHYCRLVMYVYGIWWIRIEGTPDFDARALIYNHVSLLDGPMVYIFRPFTIVAKLDIKKVPYFGQIGISDGAAFIDRSKSEGNSQLLKEVMLNHEKMPICIAPEAKISNGKVLFKFRTGAFHTTEPIQPVTIRYNELFSWGGTTRNWLMDSFFEWCWIAFASPFCYVTMTFLPTIKPSELENKTPAERAEMCQLRMANHLGVLAINRTTHDLFRKPDSTPLNVENKTV